MKKTLVFFLLCASFACKGQSFVVSPQDLVSGRLSTRSLEIVNSTNYIIAGGYKSSSGFADAGIVSLVSTSSVASIWAQVFEVGTIMKSVHRTSNGDYIACGQAPTSRGFVCRFGGAGNFLWRTNLDEGTFLYDVLEISNGNIWTCGQDPNKELLVILDASGNLLNCRQPSLGIGSILMKMIREGNEVVIFGTESVASMSFNQQISARRFDIGGNEMTHTVFGTGPIAPYIESFQDAVAVSPGGYVVVTQYANASAAGRQELGVVRLTATLVPVPLTEKVYLITDRNLVSPKIAADASNLYVFATKNNFLDGGTVAFKVLRSNGMLQTTASIARGFTRLGSIGWQGGALLLPSSQVPGVNVGTPPETVLDVALVDPSTLARQGLTCDPLQTPPNVVEAVYPNFVTANIGAVVWDDVLMIAMPGALPSSVQLKVGNCSDLALPIELLSFTGHAIDAGVELDWVTASEHRNNHFTIYRENEEGWVEVGRVGSVGDSDSEIRYSLIDTDPDVGTNYYKLRQTDLDGAYEEFDIIAVDWEPPDKFIVYPNPVEVDGRLWISREAASVFVTDNIGRFIPSELVGREVRFDGSPGTYFLLIVPLHGDMQTIEVVKR